MRQTTRPGRGASPEAIRRHYDVGTPFYSLWLDRTLSYSCALWHDDEPDDRLEAAQRRKIDYHAGLARAGFGARVLDVGCGWGAMLTRLVEAHGVGHATGLTLSKDQAEWVASRGHPSVEVRLESWADHEPAAPYDAVISIGAFEHFARPEWADADKVSAYRDFFARCHEWLKPGGWMSLQTIAYGNLDRRDAASTAGHEFLFREVFPESELPTLGQIVEASGGLLEMVALRNDRDDYRRTCRVWFDRLMARRAEAAGLVGEQVVARYLRYLKLSAILFYFGHCHLWRIAFRRLDNRRKYAVDTKLS